MSGIDQDRFVNVSTSDLDEFTCGICQLVLFEPRETQCCLQLFCNRCITQWLSANNTCPHDRRHLSSDQLRNPSRLVLNMLNKMRVKCEFYSNGCDIIKPLELIFKHGQQCDYNPVNHCKNCGVPKTERHNCIDFLVSKVKSLEMEKEQNKMTGNCFIEI